MTLYAEAEVAGLVEMWAESVPYSPLRVRAATSSVDAIGQVSQSDTGIAIAVLADLDACDECYMVEALGERSYLVQGGGDLGVQYGLAHAFELLGFRFFHPWQTYVPAVPSLDETALGELGVIHEPDIALRGIHLHTLHPIEAYRGVWDPDHEGAVDEADRIFDWIVKNRGNYVQWVGLDDVIGNAALADRWRQHSQELIARANRRGLRTGLGIQLFGQSNLQSGFDLIDADEIDQSVLDEMARRFDIIADEVPFDIYNLSFGEFFGADPAAFVASVNDAFEIMREVRPAADMLATIHVGDDEDLRVEYQGETLLYYFLVKFANEQIIPMVHTVMYYNLFEDAGGAYHHEEFDEHRAFLLERLASSQPVAYFPETAYWVAFDISVPIYAPLYVRSRWLDLDRIAGAAAQQGGEELEQHILFSSGWEWGYWQNDWASLRASFERSATWQELFYRMLSSRPGGEHMAELVIAMAEEQHHALIGQRLAGYMAGRDLYIDLGDEIDIVSQPDRTTFADLASADQDTRSEFAGSVLRQLTDHAARLADLADRAEDAPGISDRFRRELVDGMRITALRAQFIASAYQATLAHLDGRADDTDGWYQRMQDLLSEAESVVERRHSDFHFPDGDRLVGFDINATIYQWGYLEQADQLCYWHRELVEIERLAMGSTKPVPTCVQ